MRVAKFCAMAACLTGSLLAGSLARAEPAKDATTTSGTAENKPNKAALEAMLSKCSEEADAKGLFVRKGKGAERKAFRRECMHKMGVDPH